MHNNIPEHCDSMCWHIISSGSDGPAKYIHLTSYSCLNNRWHLLSSIARDGTSNTLCFKKNYFHYTVGYVFWTEYTPEPLPTLATWPHVMAPQQNMCYIPKLIVIQIKQLFDSHYFVMYFPFWRGSVIGILLSPVCILDVEFCPRGSFTMILSDCKGNMIILISFYYMLIF